MGIPFLLLATVAMLWFARLSGQGREAPIGRAGFRRAFGGVVVVGALLRFWRLGAVTPQVGWQDEWWLGWSATRFIRGELLFGPVDSPEPLFIWLAGFAFKALGEDIAAARAVSALVGSLTVPLAWWAFRPATGSRAALWISACLAVSRWHILISRIAMQYVLVPFFVLLVLGALVRAVRTGGLRWWIAGGASAGLSIYAYAGARFIPAAAVLAVVLAAAGGQVKGKDWRGPLLGLAAMLAAMVPLGIHFMGEPASFSRRFGILTQDFFADPVRTGAGNLSAFLSGFVFRGDPFATSSFPGPAGTPMLGWWGGALAVVGLGFAFRGVGTFAGGFILLFGAAMALTATMTGWGWPSGMLRSSGLLVLAALAQGAGLSRMSAAGPAGGRIAVAVLVLLAGSETAGFLVPSMRRQGDAQIIASAPRHNIILAGRLAKLAGKRPIYSSPDSHLYVVPTEALLGALKFHAGLDVRGKAPDSLSHLGPSGGLCLFVCPDVPRREFVRQMFPGTTVVDAGIVSCLERGPTVCVAEARTAGKVTLAEARDIAYQLLVADWEINKGNQLVAVDVLDRLALRFPGVAMVHSVRAMALCGMGRPGEGERDARLALRLAGGRCARALETLGLIAITRGGYANAEVLLRRSLEQDPCREVAWYNLAVVRYKRGLGVEPEGLKFLPGSAMLADIYGALRGKAGVIR